MKYLLMGLTFLAFLSGCAGLDVKRDYDTSVDFQTLKTYAWQQQPGSEAGDNSLIAERVMNSADSLLSKKGYRKISSGGADFLVSYKYYITKEADSGSGASVSVGTSFSSGFSFLGLGMGRRQQQSTEMETLGIDIVNPVSSKLMWRGFVEKELVRRSDPNKTTQDIQKMVAAILSKFPPGKK